MMHDDACCMMMRDNLSLQGGGRAVAEGYHRVRITNTKHDDWGYLNWDVKLTIRVAPALLYGAPGGRQGPGFTKTLLVGHTTSSNFKKGCPGSRFLHAFEGVFSALDRVPNLEI
jgi:hypothetical protein